MEIEGNPVGNDYKRRKLEQSLRQKEGQIKALQSQLEETKRAAEAKIDELQKSAAYWKKRCSSLVKPRKKASVETKADEAQGMRESAGEVPASPPIST